MAKRYGAEAIVIEWRDRICLLRLWQPSLISVHRDRAAAWRVVASEEASNPMDTALRLVRWRDADRVVSELGYWGEACRFTNDVVGLAPSESAV
jgi:hypothetical protein